MSPRRQRMVQDLLPGLIDHREVDWKRVANASYLVRQRFVYGYTAPIADLRHRLMIVPPERHGGQRMVLNHVSASVPGELSRHIDPWGNCVIEFRGRRVEAGVDFEAWIAVERSFAGGPARLPGDRLSDPALLEPTRMTAPTDLLAEAASQLRRGRRGGLALAEAAGAWSHRALRYRHGVTDVHTTAADALALGEGVCQDYAHVMIALCRLLGLPARYVSGHLLGEGGTHAWVEALVPDPAGSGEAVAVALDPTNGGPAGMCHVTVATGRDYRDVAPTSGVYTGDASGRLTVTKRVDVTGVEYASGRRLSA